jgi:hypothetical protein
MSVTHARTATGVYSMNQAAGCAGCSWTGDISELDEGTQLKHKLNSFSVVNGIPNPNSPKK